ncbi:MULTISPECIES: hypothetical protein [Lactococcus]|uniref:Uncharacterized protein n=2 Tax=Lactococcus petauri TaxID=1940789 RepID=A0AAJ2IX45_9LACT|nr:MULTISPECIES: hypothetical protein [Lactococcus]MCH1712130.1 hypothetical protein [Lactococcus petauri]MDT2526641.1 hypothetical protein [Lactococcus petauri]MDT2541198.1 hypothetical protein [Lactococcus petauri]MDT2557773.1 hypothetical protein [Lactococcus petauri]MDT2559894.1 hypothetical protein [Lactococcus petauri]
MLNKRSSAALAQLKELLQALESLDRLRIQRTQLNKATKREISATRNRYAFITGLIAGVFIAIALFIVTGEYILQRVDFEIFVLFDVFYFVFSSLICMVIFLLLWEKGALKHFSERTVVRINSEVQEERDRLLKATREILDSEAITQTNISLEYLTPKAIEIFQSYIQTGQCDTVREAAYIFEIDLKNSRNRYAKFFHNHESLVSQERTYIEEKGGH